MHFHYGHDQEHDSDKGAEHTIDGVHYDMEMHIVSMNQGANKDKIIAAVTGIIFQGNATKRTFADDFFEKLFKGDTDVNLSKDFTKFLNTN